MRVLVVIDDLRRAGAQRVVLQEMRALHPRRVWFEVAVLAAAAEPSFMPDLRAAGVRLHRIPGAGLCNPGRVRALQNTIEMVAPDLVHTHLSYANVLGTLAARLAHRPVVASLHNVHTNQAKWPLAKGWLEGAILNRFANQIIVVADGARAATVRKFGIPIERAVVLANALDSTAVHLPPDFARARKRRELGVSPGEHLVCTVGRLDPSKGQRYLLQALAELERRLCRQRLYAVLVGEGPERDALCEHAARLRSSVTVLGVRDDVAEIVAASDVFVLPSLNEGLPQSVLEAMALCVPVVATDVGGVSDVVKSGRTGWCVAPAQPIALADAIQEVLTKPTEAATRAEAARELVEQRFGLAEHVEHLQALYAAVLDR